MIRQKRPRKGWFFNSLDFHSTPKSPQPLRPDSLKAIPTAVPARMRATVKRRDADLHGASFPMAGDSPIHPESGARRRSAVLKAETSA